MEDLLGRKVGFSSIYATHVEVWGVFRVRSFSVPLGRLLVTSPPKVPFSDPQIGNVYQKFEHYCRILSQEWWALQSLCTGTFIVQ